MSLATDFLTSALSRYRDYKTLGDKTLAQCPDVALSRVIAPGSNSIAVIVKHLSGNMRSRWTDFLTTDGEKPWRERDAEFEEDANVSRATVRELWETGWAACLDTLTRLGPDDLNRVITIRGEPLTVIDALHRGLAHTSYHVGQMVFLAKAFQGDAWTTLSVPRGGSAEYTRRIQAEHETR